MYNFRYRFNNDTNKIDFESSLQQYEEGINLQEFAQRLILFFGPGDNKRIEIHFLKTGAFTMVFKVYVFSKNAHNVYYLKFFRNSSPVKTYTPERMKILCQREYLVLKEAAKKFKEEANIKVIKPVGIISSLACFITEEAVGANFEGYVKQNVKSSFLNPFAQWNIKSKPLCKYTAYIAKLLAKIHELDLDYSFFEEKEPFHTLDFYYKKEKFINGLLEYAPEYKEKAIKYLDELTNMANKIFPLLRPTGLSCPDTNLSNFIVNGENIFMMDFFLSQYGTCYLSTGKFMACLELILHPFVPENVVRDVRNVFIDTYNHNARNALNVERFNFFISWNYLSMFPRFDVRWKHYYYKYLYRRKLSRIFNDWQSCLK